jgi:hypothetical protein
VEDEAKTDKSSAFYSGLQDFILTDLKHLLVKLSDLASKSQV